MSKKEQKMKNSARGLVRAPDVKNQDGTVTKGAWQLVRIPFDLETGQLGDVSVEVVEDFRYGLDKLDIETEAEYFEGKQ